MKEGFGREHEQLEFSRRVSVDSISYRPVEMTIEARPAEREALARRFGLQGLDSLSATLTLRETRGGMVEVSGQLSADVVQTCVVTLEPVHNKVEDAYDAVFAPPEMLGRNAAAEAEIDIEAEDPPEPIVNGGIDIGELTAQYLSLALDPYPRCPGVSDAELSGAGSGQTSDTGPFAALSKLKRGA